MNATGFRKSATYGEVVDAATLQSSDELQRRLPDNEISVRISMGIINNKNGDFGYKFTVFFAIPVYFSVKKDSEWESMCGKQFSL